MMSETFDLRGKRYSLTREQVEQTMRYISPKPVDKYLVWIDGRPYPPKQLIAAALGVPLATFTTIDAHRILSHLGFEIQESDSEKPRTESEILFEQCLEEHGLNDYEFEAEHPGKSKRPDYRLKFGQQEILFDVKEFRATLEDFRRGGGAYDPYVRIREKMGEARKKFQEYKDCCCCLVLFNREKPLVDLGWEFIYGAMLGNLALRMPFDHSRQALVPEAAKRIFASGGKMRQADNQGNTRAIQNTTISAILVLELIPIGLRKFEIEVAGREKELGRKLSFEEHWMLFDSSGETERDWSLRRLRVVVNENPFTGAYGGFSLPEKIFCGRYDERYGYRDGHIQRIYVGEEIAKLEESEKSRAVT